MDQDLLVFSQLASGFAHCKAVVTEHGGLMTSLFVAGLLGGATHCAGMCGPFVIAQVVSRLETRPAAEMREFHRLAGAALIPYHLGRATTYAVLGAAAGLLAAGVIDLTGFKWVSGVLLALAALFFLGYAVRRLGIRVAWLASGGEGWWSEHVGRVVRPLFSRPIGIKGYALGVALGFLPCGLLYGALAAASSTGSALTGALAMVFFTVGTIPALLAVGLAGHVAGRHWQAPATRVMPLLMVVNAAALSYLAWKVMV